MRILRHVAVPFWSSVLADARHLPHGRSPGGDRHLNFYGNRDNLLPSFEEFFAAAYGRLAGLLFALLHGRA